MANALTLEPLARALPPHVRLWAPELPGHGAHANVPFTWDAAVAQILAVIDEAGEAPLVLAGDSLGGYLALAAAVRTSTPLAGIVAGGCTYALRGFGGALARASDVPVRALEALVGEARVARVFARAFASIVYDRAFAERVAARGLAIHSRTESLRELLGRDVLALVPNIAAPITFVNGAYDMPIVFGTRTYARAARRGRVAIIPCAGHAVSVLRPAEFAAEIMRYL